MAPAHQQLTCSKRQHDLWTVLMREWGLRLLAFSPGKISGCRFRRLINLIAEKRKLFFAFQDISQVEYLL